MNRLDEKKKQIIDIVSRVFNLNNELQLLKDEERSIKKDIEKQTVIDNVAFIT